MQMVNTRGGLAPPPSRAPPPLYSPTSSSPHTSARATAATIPGGHRHAHERYRRIYLLFEGQLVHAGPSSLTGRHILLPGLAYLHVCRPSLRRSLQSASLRARASTSQGLPVSPFCRCGKTTLTAPPSGYMCLYGNTVQSLGHS